MDYFSFLFKGLLIGLSIAAPVGPIGVLCIRRTLAQGRVSGFVTGMGAATADGLYGAVAGFGLTIVSNFLINEQMWLRLIGGLFLCYLGLKTFRSKPGETSAQTKVQGAFGDYTSTLFLTLTNPLTIISFAAIFAGLGLAATGRGYGSAGVLVLGVFCGSALWWLVLSNLVNLFRNRIQSTGLQWVNRVSGLIITCFGIFALASMRA